MNLVQVLVLALFHFSEAWFRRVATKTYFTSIHRWFHKFPSGILQNVPIKVGDFYVLDDISVSDMVIDAYARLF